MIIRFAKRFLFVIAFLLILMMYAAPSLGQIVESEGYASWYNRGDDGSETASGEKYDHASMTAAHPILPFDSMVRVTRLDTGRSVVVRINDRMDTGPGHIIDLSGAAASRLGLLDVNIARVKLDLERPEDLLHVRERLAVRYREEAAARMKDLAEVPIPELTEPVESKKYTLQLGVFTSQPAAAAFASDFESGWITEISSEGSPMYRVYYDRFADESPARTAQRQLKENGHDSFLREIL